MNDGDRGVKETTKHNWLNWLAIIFVVFGNSFHLSNSRGRYVNNVLVECVAWIDYSALLCGGSASLVILVFWFLNTDEKSKTWKRALRIVGQCEGFRLFLYGAGADVGLGSACN